MTDALTLTITLLPARKLAAEQRITARAMGPIGRLTFLIYPLVGAFALGMGLAWHLGFSLDDAGLICLYSFIGAVLGLVVAQRFWVRRSLRLAAAAPLRNQPVTVTLSADGISFPGKSIGWTQPPPITRWKECSLLLLSPLDVLVIPDADLPPGETPQTLAARIAEWTTQ